MLFPTLARRLNPLRKLPSLSTQPLSTLPSLSTQPLSTLPSSAPPPTPQFDSTTVVQTLSSYNNDWKRALDFFNWVEAECGFLHTTDTYNRMIDILGKFFEFDHSWTLVDRMSKNPLAFPNYATFRVIFKRYLSAHLVDEAIVAYDRSSNFNLKDETCCFHLVDALCEYKHVVEAVEFLFGRGGAMRIGSMDPRSVTKVHNMILRGWFKMGWWGQCKGFWEEMDRKGVKKDLHSYSIYMDIMCKSGKPWKAVKLYKDMKSKGMKLDVVAYNTVILAVGLSKGVDFAKGVYREMREAGCVPNVTTRNIIIKLLCENERMKEAYEMFDQMNKQGVSPDVNTYHYFFGYLQKPKEILLLFDRMIETGIRPRMDTFVMLLRKFGRWGFLRPVFDVWKKMEELGYSPDKCAYDAFIDILIEKGMLDMARKYDAEMLAKGLSPKPREALSTRALDENNFRVCSPSSHLA